MAPHEPLASLFPLCALNVQKVKVLSSSDEQEMIERLYTVKTLPEV